MSEIIKLPNNWEARPYQLNAWRYLAYGGKRAVMVWHRRSGKDEIGLHHAACAAYERVGNYWHMLPEAKQARKAIWEAVNPHSGLRRIDEAFPQALREGQRDDEMIIRFKNGSTWQVVGSDNYNSLVGSPPVGIFFSEYSVAKPQAWDYLRPILAENNGWAIFAYTPRGENHGYELYQMARNNPDWFSEILTVNDTNALPPAIIASERTSGMPEEMVQQEYYCSFAGVLVGSFFGALLNEAERDDRIIRLLRNPGAPVHTAWDLGWRDDTAIWFFQMGRGEINVIDYWEGNGKTVEEMAAMLQAKRYVYGDHWVPHDAKPETLASGGRSIMEQFHKLGVKVRLCADLSVQNGIQAARLILPRCFFDADKCAPGLKALRHYQREWDEDRRCFRDKPLHNWASHAADAFRSLAVGYRELEPGMVKLPDNGMEGVTMDLLWKDHERAQGRRERI